MKLIQFGELLKEPIRNGLTKPKSVRGHGVGMISMGEIFSHNRIFKLEMDKVPVTDKELTNCRVKPGDLLFARQSLVLDGAGKCSIVVDAYEDTVFESHLIHARVDDTKANPYFVYYYFNSRSGRENIKTIVEQVAAAGIRGSDLIRLYVPCPEIKNQNQIVGILDAIDSKIELNQKINDNLSA
ncbi:MAG: restriction endonuclease subunit S [Faecalibacterium prausnitzii]|jgi:type I restriction enzyme S subunit|nr:restriction endonuclease subunit S [Faecalibacterium prausnitzii]